MATIAAATGVLKVPEAVPTRRTLSFSSSVSLSDEKASLRRGSVFSRGGRVRNNPMIVSPKAVSDSQNSQTCLDPDASRVSINNIRTLESLQLAD